jgi:integrase
MKYNSLTIFDKSQLLKLKSEIIEVDKISESAINCKRDAAIVQLIAIKNQINKYIKSAISDNTRRAYKSDLEHFLSWGGSIPSTPEFISYYLAAHATEFKPSTLSRRLISIGRAHTTKNLPSPISNDLIKTTLRGIRRTISTKQRQVSPVLKDDLVKMVNGLNGKKGCRDRALLLIGFAGALRRSELVGLKFDDIEFVEQGLIVYLRKSKTDQLGEGRKIAIPYARGATCPVISLKHWLEAGGITEGALFRPITRYERIENNALSTQAVAVIVKQRAAAIGLDASKFSGHSLRAGLVTSAAQSGVSTWKIKQQTGHKSDAMLNRYIRDANIFVDNAAGAVL